MQVDVVGVLELLRFLEIETMAEEACPPFVAGAPRYSSETFGGRLKNIISQLNPLMLLKSSGEVDAAKALLARHKAGTAGGVGDEALWAAAELCAARVHPDTDENIALPLCFAAYAPMQPPIIVGMLWPGGGALNQAFWQVYNQVYNSAVFFANKNKSSEVSDSDAMLSLAGSVSASLALGVGFNRLGAAIKHPKWGPLVSGWAGFAGCVGAGWASLLLMRRDELANGVNVVDADGTVHGQSKAAARVGIAKCCASRVVWNIPATGITPLALAKWHATPLCASLPLAPKLAVDAAICTTGVVMGVYPGQALFTQKAEINAADLEPEFHAKATKDGAPVATFFYNKGL